MTCARCQGPMMVDAVLEVQEEEGHLWLGAARCVGCGQLLDLGRSQYWFDQRSGWRMTRAARRTRPRRFLPLPMTVGARRAGSAAWLRVPSGKEGPRLSE